MSNNDYPSVGTDYLGINKISTVDGTECFGVQSSTGDQVPNLLLPPPPTIPTSTESKRVFLGSRTNISEDKKAKMMQFNYCPRHK